MKLYCEENYPIEERELVIKINRLFKQWMDSVLRVYGIGESKKFENIVVDGFYPYYTQQKVKILFIGRESLGIAGSNYIEILHDAYKNERIGGVHINRKSFHNRMFYLSYALNKDITEWKNVPYADKLQDEFATAEGFSFAFINLSKFSNCSRSWAADWERISTFVEKFGCLEGINFLNEEIRILNPDLVITMNLGKYLGYLGKLKIIEKSKDLNHYKLKVGNHQVNLFDMFHFSATNKKSKDNYFIPMMKFLNNESI